MARDYSFRHAPASRTMTPRQATTVVVPSRIQASRPNDFIPQPTTVQQDISIPKVAAQNHDFLAASVKTAPTYTSRIAPLSVSYSGGSMEFIKPRVRRPESPKSPKPQQQPEPSVPIAATSQERVTLIVPTAEKAKMVKKRRRARSSLLSISISKLRLSSVLTYGLVAMVIVAGGLITLQTLQTNAESKAQVARLRKDAEAIASGQSSTANAQAAGASSSTPAPYSVAPDLPKYISIPKLNMHNIKIVQVGLTKDGAIGAPLTATSTAWYTGSAKPGDVNGAMFIDGHVMGEANGGAVLTALKTLTAGDTITITRGDDKTFTFEVVKKATVALDAVDMAEMLKSADAAKLGLNLMTCGGTYDKKTQTFDHRTEVFAVLRK